MRVLPKDGFRTRMIAAAIATVAVLAAVAIVIDVRELRQHLRAEMKARTDLVSDLTRDAIAPALWDFDVGQVEELTKAAAANALVLSVTVRDARGRMVAEVADNSRAIAQDDVLRMRAITFGDGPHPRTIGSLELMFDGQAVEGALSVATQRRVLLALLMLFAVGIGLHLVLGHLSRPLPRIGERIAAIGRGELDTPMPYTQRGDIIGDLARALDTLRRREGELRTMRAANAEVSRRERHRIGRALDALEDAVIVLDEERTVLFVNPATERLFPEIAVRRRFSADSLACCAKELAGLLDTKKRAGFDTSVPGPSGGPPTHLHVRSAPIQDEKGIDLGHVLIATDTTERVRQEARVRYLADHDFLTGLANRRTLDRTLLAVDGQAVAVGLIDLDHFKRINDTLGHGAGDQYLMAVAAMIRRATAEGDVAVRQGGDEFAIVCAGGAATERLRASLDALVTMVAEPVEVEGQQVECGLSIGVAGAEAGAATAAAVMRRADLALYEAKRGGRGRVEWFHQSMEQELIRRLAVERALRGALAHDRLFAVFQRQTASATGATVGFEALARWTDEALGFVSPGEFIPLAEETGLIEPLTEAMIAKSADFVLKARELGFAGRVGINVSPKLFNGRADTLILGTLAEHNCPASLVEVEITEQVFLSDRPAIQLQLARLRAAGITIALDDFGVGYSSLSYLQKLPVDKLKIDRSFVARIASDTTRAIVHAIAQLGDALSMTVIAEGAETDEQKTVLRLCGIPQIQGFVDGKPAAAEVALSRLGQELVAQNGTDGWGRTNDLWIHNPAL